MKSAKLVCRKFLKSIVSSSSKVKLTLELEEVIKEIITQTAGLYRDFRLWEKP